MLPKVFAIYRRETETFQLLTTESDEAGNLIRFKPWAKPTIEEIRNNPELECWANGGQEWYVVPTYNQGSAQPPDVHRFKLHNQGYCWWSLRHTLVWSDYLTHAQRRDSKREEWMASPRIPVLDFSSKLIYPRTILDTYPRWCDSSPSKLEMEAKRGYENFKENQDTPNRVDLDDHIDPKDLRIRTPQPRDDDEEPDSNHKARHYAPRAKSWSQVSDEISCHIDNLANPNSLCCQMATRGLIGFMATLFCFGTVLLMV